MTGANHLQLDTPSVARFARFSRALGSLVGATFAMVMAVAVAMRRRMVAMTNHNVEKLASHEHLSLKQAHNAMLT